MKRFIISVLCVSVFFIGIGSIIEKTSAKFKSDEKALEIINRARTAIGGDTNLRNVQSMTIKANVTHTLETPETQDVRGGTMEINMQLPGLFSKMIQIGNPDNTNGETEIVKNVDVIVMKKDGGETVDLKGVGENGNKRVIVIQKAEDGKTDGNARVESDKGVFVTSDGEEKIIVRKNGSDDATWTDEKGNTVILDKKMHAKHGGEMRNNEMLRTTIGLLLTAPQGLDVTYKYLGTGNVDGSSVEIIGVEALGSSFKLFIDASTYLPKMISFEGGHHQMVFIKKGDTANMSKDKVIEFKSEMPNAGTTEHQIKFGDFRNVNGVLLPHRWTESVSGKTTMTTDITSYEINPANIADKFKDQKVMVRTVKPIEKN